VGLGGGWNLKPRTSGDITRSPFFWFYVSASEVAILTATLGTVKTFQFHHLLVLQVELKYGFNETPEGKPSKKIIEFNLSTQSI